MSSKKRLIDANALTDVCRTKLMADVFPDWRNMSDKEKNVAVKLGGAFKRIHSEAPTVDAVEVVRCKDCKWYKEGKYLAPNKFCYRLKDRSGEHIGYNYSDDDFCSYGERREGE